jgi:hypothetical protein
MQMLSTSQQAPRAQRWLTLLFILSLHVVVLWIARPVPRSRAISEIQYLHLFNVNPAIKTEPETVAVRPPPQPNIKNTITPQLARPETSTANAQATIEPTTQSISSAPVADTNPGINLDALHGQAMKNERVRPISGMEKLQNSQKLNLSVEAKLDRALNQIELPECRAMLLGKSMPERMRIIQDHSRKKNCW